MLEYAILLTRFLYIGDEIHDPEVTVKVIARQ